MTFWQEAAKEILEQSLRPLVQQQISDDEVIRKTIDRTIREKERGVPFDYQTIAYCLLKIVPRGPRWQSVRLFLNSAAVIY